MTRRLGVVDVLALRAVELHSAHVGKIGLAHREKRVPVTHNTRTFTKVTLLVLVKLDVSISWSFRGGLRIPKR